MSEKKEAVRGKNGEVVEGNGLTGTIQWTQSNEKKTRISGLKRDRYTIEKKLAYLELRYCLRACSIDEASHRESKR